MDLRWQKKKLMRFGSTYRGEEPSNSNTKSILTQQSINERGTNHQSISRPARRVPNPPLFIYPISAYEGEDRISPLPDELIHEILKFVDTKLAVQTSVLSKRWKLVWTTLPFLKFDDGMVKQGSSKNTIKLTRHVLNHRNHQSHISNLELLYLPPGLTDKFVKYAISHHVQDLNIRLRRDDYQPKLSNLSSSSIQKLELRIQLEKLMLKSDCWDLPSLTTLHLRHLHTGSVYQELPVLCLTCLPALRTLYLTFWDFRKSYLYLSLPDLTTLHLSMCKLPKKVWNLPALKTLTLDNVDFLGNLTDVLAALVSLQNLTLHRLSMHDCFISCPQLINLEIMTRYNHTSTIKGNIRVLAPKLTNFTSVGIFRITFEDSKLDNVCIKLPGPIEHMGSIPKKLKEYYQGFTFMLPGLGSAKILNFDVEAIEVLSSISYLLVRSPSPFSHLKYVKLPHGFEEASIPSILRNYLLDGSPTATIVTTSIQNLIPHTATASVTAQNVVIEETLAASTKLVDSEDVQKTDTVDVRVQNSEVHVGSLAS